MTEKKSERPGGAEGTDKGSKREGGGERGCEEKEGDTESTNIETHKEHTHRIHTHTNRNRQSTGLSGFSTLLRQQLWKELE